MLLAQRFVRVQTELHSKFREMQSGSEGSRHDSTPLTDACSPPGFVKLEKQGSAAGHLPRGYSVGGIC